ncbi:MAG TPA: ABC transporter permease, partial [Chitinophagaceae bacterium]|nr:ABC transporter permease [Chitinophagaceae bacterium]
MQRILATYIKEWHLMRRDLGGLALLFLMPMLLIIIMALVQDAPFKDYKDHQFEAIFVDEDGGKVATLIKQGLLDSKQFQLTESYENIPITTSSTKELIQKGTYQFAIIVKKGITAEVVNSANLIANEMGRQLGIQGSLPHRETRDSMSVQLMFDPVSKPAFRLAITNVVEKFITKIQSDFVLERIGKLAPKADSSNSQFDFEKQLRSVGVEEISSQEKKLMVNKMNSVQHTVPAWAIFGMFFMIIIISGSMITERLGGSWTRLQLIPGSFSHILIGKMLFYVILGSLQF